MKLPTLILLIVLPATLPAAAPTLTLASPIGTVASVTITELRLADGANGSITFNAYTAAGVLVAPSARGALFIAPLAGLPSEIDIRAAVAASLTPVSSN